MRLVPGLVAIEVAPVHHYFDKTPEGPTELGFSYTFLGIIAMAFVVVIAMDVYIKHGPKPTPGKRLWYKRKFDKAKGGYYVCKDTFNRLFVRRKQRLDLESAATAQRTFDSQKIIDRLAAKPATEKAPSMVENAEAKDKSTVPMTGVEVEVTPLDMPFLRDTDTVAQDGIFRSANAGGGGAAGYYL
jgi:hypothetical protein